MTSDAEERFKSLIGLRRDLRVIWLEGTGESGKGWQNGDEDDAMGEASVH